MARNERASFAHRDRGPRFSSDAFSARTEKLVKRFREVAAFPSNYCDFIEYDSENRRLGVHVDGKFAIKFWNDSADQHVKVLDVHFADRSR